MAIKRKLKECYSQSILETVLVFVALALLAVGAMQLFAKLNFNQFKRLSDFKKTRLAALNNIAINLSSNNPASPKYYLKFGDRSNYRIISIIPQVEFSGDFLQDKRLVEAQLKLKEFDTILNYVFPYKANQMNKIITSNASIISRYDKLYSKKTYYCGLSSSCRNNYYYSCYCYKNQCDNVLNSAEYNLVNNLVNEISNLANDTINDINLAYNDLYNDTTGVVALMNDTLRSPYNYTIYDLPHCKSLPPCLSREKNGTYYCLEQTENNFYVVNNATGEFRETTCEPVSCCDAGGDFSSSCPDCAEEERLPDKDTGISCQDYQKLYCTLQHSVLGSRTQLNNTMYSLDNPTNNNDTRANIEMFLYKVRFPSNSAIKGLINSTNNSQSNYGGLNYISNWINKPNGYSIYPCYNYNNYNCECVCNYCYRYSVNWANQNIALKLINDTINFVGTQNNCIVNSTAALVFNSTYQDIKSVFDKFFDEHPHLHIKDSYNLTGNETKILNSVFTIISATNATINNPDTFTLNNLPDQELQYLLRGYGNRNINITNERGEVVQVPLSDLLQSGFGSTLINDIETIKNQPLVFNIIQQLTDELKVCLDAWTDYERSCSDSQKDTAECKNKDLERIYNLGQAYIDSEALDKITAINRRQRQEHLQYLK